MADSNNPYTKRYFDAHVNDVTDECMIWPYRVDRQGYGRVTIDRRQQLVTALACIAWNGPRPPGMEAAHGPCHNPSCWNGQHLSWKTRTENNADKARDGTLLQGEAAPGVKLAAAEVLTIRHLAAGGMSQTAIAETYGVLQSTVSRIINGKTWASL